MPTKDKKKQAEMFNRWYLKNKQKVLDNNKRRKKEIQAYVKALKEDNPCTDCGQHFPYYCMEFDHRDPSTKLTNISRLIRYWGRKKLDEELEKCDLVCGNCHRKRTFAHLEDKKRIDTP